MPNNIEDLRAHLFETLRALADKTAPMDLGRAQAVAEVARVIVDSARVEVDFLRVTGGLRSTNFLPDGDEQSEQSATAGRQLPGPHPIRKPG